MPSWPTRREPGVCSSPIGLSWPRRRTSSGCRPPRGSTACTPLAECPEHAPRDSPQRWLSGAPAWLRSDRVRAGERHRYGLVVPAISAPQPRERSVAPDAVACPLRALVVGSRPPQWSSRRVNLPLVEAMGPAGARSSRTTLHPRPGKTGSSAGLRRQGDGHFRQAAGGISSEAKVMKGYTRVAISPMAGPDRRRWLSGRGGTCSGRPRGEIINRGGRAARGQFGTRRARRRRVSTHLGHDDGLGLRPATCSSSEPGPT
jgi:hypothetical protein